LEGEGRSRGEKAQRVREWKVEIVKDLPAERKLKEAIKKIKKVKRGSIIYTDKFKACDGLVIWCILMG
jgi:transposase-like protein